MAYHTWPWRSFIDSLSFRFIPPSTSMMKAKTAQNLSYEEIVLEASKSKHINKRRLLIHMEKEFLPSSYSISPLQLVYYP